MNNFAPNIFRQRLLIEGFYTIEVTKELLQSYLLQIAAHLQPYLLQIAAHLQLRTYGEPIIFSPASGMGREENSGFDAFVPLINSGISAYI